MTKVLKYKYGEKKSSEFDTRRALEEASRCLLCEDAPCSKGCPAKTDPGKFIRSIRFKNFKGAAETIRKNNILGGTCALVCPYDKLCEKECARCGIDRPIEIGKLQKFAIDQEKLFDMDILEASTNKKDKKVACIGAGPASLACAAELLKIGIDVTIFEQFDKAGGVLSYGITPSRLPQDVVDHDINQLKKLGVKFEFNKKVDKVLISDIEKEYDAILIGIGLWKDAIPDIKGIELDGVYSALEFLKSARENTGNIKIGKDVIVIGGGDVALDCATTAKQLDAENVRIVYRRTIEEAPANFLELQDIYKQGIPIFTKFAPEEIVGENGKVIKMNFKSWDEVSTMEIKADMVVFATGQKIEEEFNDFYNKNNYFTAGDALNGGKTVVEAVADGKKAAQDIINFLNIDTNEEEETIYEK